MLQKLQTSVSNESPVEVDNERVYESSKHAESQYRLEPIEYVGIICKMMLTASPYFYNVGAKRRKNVKVDKIPKTKKWKNIVKV